MEVPKKYWHDRLVLLLLTLIAILLVVGVSLVLLRFDPLRNPTTTAAYRPNITGTQYLPGKPIDIYALAVYMAFTAALALFLSNRVYHVRRFVSIFLLASTVFLLLLAIIVSNSLISLQ